MTNSKKQFTQKEFTEKEADKIADFFICDLFPGRSIEGWVQRDDNEILIGYEDGDRITITLN